MTNQLKKYPLRSDRSILRQGKRVRGRLMELFTLPSPTPRQAVIVGKNVSLKATARNLVRRRLSAALVEMIPDLGRDVVIRALPASRETTYAQLETELHELLAKV